MITFFSLTPTFFSLTPVEHKVNESIGGNGEHFIAYFILFIIAKKVHTKSNYLTCAIICCIYSFSIECIQYFIPNRDFEGLDMIAGSLGIFLGVIIYKLFIEKYFEIKQIAT
jgi:VanZ family protein